MPGPAAVDRPPSVALIVDNPLRDLDGIVMVAWQLAQRGVHCYLTPMYDQAFVIDAVKPDLVLANYIRPNNLALLRRYKGAGCRIAIVDSEGNVGQHYADLARHVLRSPDRDMIDAYCVWGEGQERGFLELDVIPRDRLHLTGCPRYDFAAPQWRDALKAPAIDPGYILINTNFQGANPRFSAGPDAERATLLRMGLDPAYVAVRIAEDKLALDGMYALIETLVKTFPKEKFVLRPHPFESAEYYKSLTSAPNFQVRQEGTSLEWVNASSLMLHLNCSTAVEAVMLDKEPTYPSWLDTPSIHVEGTAAVSRRSPDVSDMIAMISQLLAGAAPALGEDVAKARRTIITEVYRAIDGQSASRIADVVMQTLAAPPAPPSAVHPGLKGRVTWLIQRAVGPGLWYRFRAMFDRKLEARRAAKGFDGDYVSNLTNRISAVGGGRPLRVTAVKGARGAGSAILIRQDA